MATEHVSMAAALTEAAQVMHAPTTVEETLEAIAEATLKTIPGFDHAGISITHRDGRIETMTGTDRLVWDLDDLQYGLREGPCYDAIRGAGVVLVENAPDDPRWPRYLPAAAEKGLRSQLAVGLYQDGDSMGGLNLYSTASETIAKEAVLIAELFATQAAIALGRSTEHAQLNDALVSRTVIGQATGIMMERYQLDEARAFQFLIRASSTSNTKLRDIAREVVRTAIDRPER